MVSLSASTDCDQFNKTFPLAEKITELFRGANNVGVDGTSFILFTVIVILLLGVALFEESIALNITCLTPKKSKLPVMFAVCVLLFTLMVKLFTWLKLYFNVSPSIDLKYNDRFSIVEFSSLIVMEGMVAFKIGLLSVLFIVTFMLVELKFPAESYAMAFSS